MNDTITVPIIRNNKQIGKKDFSITSIHDFDAIPGETFFVSIAGRMQPFIFVQFKRNEDNNYILVK